MNGPADVDAAAPWLSLAGLALVVLTQVWFMRANFGLGPALLAALASACSPLLLGRARAGGVELLAAAAELAGAWKFLGLLRKHDGLRSAAFAATFGIALALSERALVWLAPFAVALAAARGAANSARPVMALGLALALGAVGWAVRGRSPLETLTDASTPWYRALIELWLLSPSVAIPAACAMFVVAWLAARGERDAACEFLALCAACLVALGAVIADQVAELVAVDALLRALLVAAAARVVNGPTARRRRFAAVLLCLCACAGDLASYRELFVVQRVGAPSIQRLLEARGMLPVIERAPRRDGERPSGAAERARGRSPARR